jgi:hypothetical protein
LIYDDKISNNEQTITTIAYSKITKVVREQPLRLIILGSIVGGIIVLIPIILVLHFVVSLFSVLKICSIDICIFLINRSSIASILKKSQ